MKETITVLRPLRERRIGMIDQSAHCVYFKNNLSHLFSLNKNLNFKLYTVLNFSHNC